MTKNHMPEVAKMLGVEMGERFKIKNSFSTDTYWFERWGIAQTINPNGRNEGLLNSLLNGNEEIEKLPFKPKEGDIYYSYMWSELLRGAVIVNTMFVSSDAQCRSDYMLGNCYRTEAECEADTAMKERIENMERCKW